MIYRLGRNTDMQHRKRRIIDALSISAELAELRKRFTACVGFQMPSYHLLFDASTICCLCLTLNFEMTASGHAKA